MKVPSVWKTIESWVQKVWDMTAPPATPQESATFSTGDLWNETKLKHGLDDDTMFELFKKPFLTEIAERQKGVNFTDHPIESGDYFLQKEFRFLESLNYTFNADDLTMNPPKKKGAAVHVTTVDDLSDEARRYFAANGGYHAVSVTEGEVQLILYGTEIFYLCMPAPTMTTFSFAYRVSEKVRTFEFFGEWLSAQNTPEDLHRAFAVLNRFARLRLPDKYLDAWDASHSEASDA